MSWMATGRGVFDSKEVTEEEVVSNGYHLELRRIFKQTKSWFEERKRYGIIFGNA